ADSHLLQPTQSSVLGAEAICLALHPSQGDGIARIYGLDEVMAGELVEFEEGTIGIALNLESNNVGVVLMGDAEGRASDWSEVVTR
ncbi:hypothetical protein HN873_029168, partial [Arachis hypogaea]